MRIGIDMRMAGTGEGIGRYVEELVKHLAGIDKNNEYFLFFREKFPISPPPGDLPKGDNFQFPNFHPIETPSRYYSLEEQTRFVWELKRLKLDLMHFPNFNHPIFYPGKFIVTIHDMIHHEFPGKKKSHYIHRLAYRLVFSRAIKKSEKIIAVSHATKTELLKHYTVQGGKIKVIHEGVDDVFFSDAGEERASQVRQKYGITRPYLLFVGVWRQYKNLPRLALAFDAIRHQGHDLQLVLAGKVDPFYPEIRKRVMSAKYAGDIISPGFVPDEDLPALYQGAAAFVLPSLTEGFGLIGIEAQASGVPVVASDIEVLREVYGDAARYFDPGSEKGMAQKIKSVLDNQELRRDLVNKGRENAFKYKWQKVANDTLKVYQS